MAPELFDLSCDDFSKVDTFSCGIILINMLTGLKYLSLTEIEWEFSTDPSLVSLLKQMLEPDYKQRVSLESVL